MATNNRTIVVVIDTTRIRRQFDYHITPVLDRRNTNFGMTFEDLLNCISYLAPMAHDELTLDVCLSEAVDSLEFENPDDFLACQFLLQKALGLVEKDLVEIGQRYPTSSINFDDIKGDSAYFIVEPEG